jgi:hypothetical protein
MSSRDEDGGSDNVADEERRADVETLPFPAQGPFGRTTTGERVRVVTGSRVLSIIGGPSPPYTVVLEISGDVETVIDGYAEQLGCHPKPDARTGPEACVRSPGRFELVGLAGGDFYSLSVADGLGGRLPIGVLSYADG